MPRFPASWRASPARAVRAASRASTACSRTTEPATQRRLGPSRTSPSRERRQDDRGRGRLRPDEALPRDHQRGRGARRLLLLGSAASYTVTIVIVLAGALWPVLALADGLHSTTGVESSIAQVVLALGCPCTRARAPARLATPRDRRIDRSTACSSPSAGRSSATCISSSTKLSRCASPDELATAAGRRMTDGLRLDAGRCGWLP